MINISTEKIIPLKDAAKGLPCRRRGRPTNVTTLFRWSTKGLRGHKLETVLIGGVRCTSAEALQRFLHALNNGNVADSNTAAADDAIVDAGLRAHGLIGPDESSPVGISEGTEPEAKAGAPEG